jgi:hypothetical protein
LNLRDLRVSTLPALRWAGGLPWYQSDFYEGRWVPALAAARAAVAIEHLIDLFGPRLIFLALD